jgi:hypothetical protein
MNLNLLCKQITTLIGTLESDNQKLTATLEQIKYDVEQQSSILSEKIVQNEE